jgi:hypothetical protein
MMEAQASETLVNLYQSIWPYNPEDIHFHTHHRENVKSYYKILTDVSEDLTLSINKASVKCRSIYTRQDATSSFSGSHVTVWTYLCSHTEWSLKLSHLNQGQSVRDNRINPANTLKNEK